MRALVSHSGMQHSHQLAWALEEADALAAFVSGVPVSSGRWLARSLGLRWVPIPASKRLHLPLLAWGQRHLSRGLSAERQQWLAHGLHAAFDEFVAALIPWIRPDVVVCFETAAERSFAAARKIGAFCVLDAASMHYQAQRAWLGLVDTPSLRATEARKQRELDAADLVITCSELAMKTFTEGGVSPHKLRALPLGTELPTGRSRPHVAAGHPLRIAFVGTVRRLKGVDLLIEASRRLRERGHEVVFTVIGSWVEPDLVERARRTEGIRVLGSMPQADVFEVLARHDLLVLPSRLDSFGMVVPEAMSLGLPCIVSTRAGARCIIERHPGSGWLIEPEVEALSAAIEAICLNPGLLEAAGAAAARAARDYTWEEYRAKLRSVLLDAVRHDESH